MDDMAQVHLGENMQACVRRMRGPTTVTPPFISGGDTAEERESRDLRVGVLNNINNADLMEKQ